MPSALGAPSLALLLPRCDRDHPLVEIALSTVSNLDGLDRDRVLAALLAGPLAEGAVPPRVISAAAVANLDARMLTDLVIRLGADCTAPLAATTWERGERGGRVAVLESPGVSERQRRTFLRDASAGSLGALLDVDARPPLSEQSRLAVVDALLRQSGDAVVHTGDRSHEPRAVERVLSAHGVDRESFVALLRALPKSIRFEWGRNSDIGYAEQDRAHRAWENQAVEIWRTQRHLVVAAMDGTLADAADNPQDRLHPSHWLAVVTERFGDIMDALDDDDLERAVLDRVVDARQARHEADLLANAIGVDNDTDQLFDRWLQLRADHPRRTKAIDEATPEEVAQWRKFFDEFVADDLEKTAQRAQGSALGILNQLIGLVTESPEAGTFPTPGSSSRWRSTSAKREEVWHTVAPELAAAINWPLGQHSDVRAWAEIMHATLVAPRLPGVPPPDVAQVREQAQAWAAKRPHRSLYMQDPDDRAIQDLLNATAPPPSPRPLAEEVFAAALDAVRHQPSDEAVDHALDVAVSETASASDVDAVLDLPEVSDPRAAIERLAVRLEQVVRARIRPVTAQSRSRAAGAVLRSAHLTRDALLDLPAFAVFGPESQPFWPRPGDGDHVASLLLDLGGGDAARWRALSRLEVANRGVEAWTPARDVLRRAGADV